MSAPETQNKSALQLCVENVLQVTPAKSPTLEEIFFKDLEDKQQRIFKKVIAEVNITKEEKRIGELNSAIKFYTRHPESLNNLSEEILQQVVFYCQKKGVFVSQLSSNQRPFSSYDPLLVYRLFNSSFIRKSRASDPSIKDILSRELNLSTTARTKLMNYVVAGEQDPALAGTSELLLLSMTYHLKQLKSFCKISLENHLTISKDPKSEMAQIFREIKPIISQLVSEDFFDLIQVFDEEDLIFLIKLTQALSQYPDLFLEPEKEGIFTEKERQELTAFLRGTKIFEYLFSMDPPFFHHVYFLLQSSEYRKILLEKKDVGSFSLSEEPMKLLNEYILFGTFNSQERDACWQFIEFAYRWQISHLHIDSQLLLIENFKKNGCFFNEAMMRDAKELDANIIRAFFLEHMLNALGEETYEVFVDGKPMDTNTLVRHAGSWEIYQGLCVQLYNQPLSRLNTKNFSFQHFFILLRQYDDIEFYFGEKSQHILQEILEGSVRINSPPQFQEEFVDLFINFMARKIKASLNAASLIEEAFDPEFPLNNLVFLINPLIGTPNKDLKETLRAKIMNRLALQCSKEFLSMKVKEIQEACNEANFGALEKTTAARISQKALEKNEMLNKKKEESHKYSFLNSIIEDVIKSLDQEILRINVQYYTNSLLTYPFSHPDVILPPQLQELLHSCLKKIQGYDSSALALWNTYLLPYHEAAVKVAKSITYQSAISHARHMPHPDITDLAKSYLKNFSLAYYNYFKECLAKEEFLLQKEMESISKEIRGLHRKLNKLNISQTLATTQREHILMLKGTERLALIDKILNIKNLLQ